jgi:hypothetical protein
MPVFEMFPMIERGLQDNHAQGTDTKMQFMIMSVTSGMLTMREDAHDQVYERNDPVDRN